MRRHRIYLARFKVLEEEIEKQNNELKAMMKTFDTGMTPRYKITWKNQKVRYFDVKKFKRDEPAIYEKYAPEKDQRTLRVTVRKI